MSGASPPEDSLNGSRAVDHPGPVILVDLPDLPPYPFAVHAEPDRYISWSISNLGTWDPLETELIRRALAPGDAFLDVGANIGWFTVLAAHRVGSDGAVFSLEPEPANHRLLIHNLALNRLSWVVSEQAAAGPRSEPVRLYRSPDNLGDHRTYPSPGVGNPIAVRSLRLDSHLEPFRRPLDLAKIDCQGAEVGVLEGFWNRLVEDRPSLVIEFWPFGLEASGSGTTALLERLDALGGLLFAIDDASGRLLPTSVHRLDRRSREDLHPDGAGHLDLLWLPERNQVHDRLSALL